MRWDSCNGSAKMGLCLAAMMMLDSMVLQPWCKEALKSVFARERALENETPPDSESPLAKIGDYRSDGPPCAWRPDRGQPRPVRLH